MAKHTPEPWINSSLEIGSFPIMGIKIVSRVSGNSYEEAKANADRIVSCVNACVDIDYPEKFIPAIRSEMKQIRETIGANENESTYDEVARLKYQRDQLLEQLEKLLDMHCREQEGIGIGMPTPSEWFNAVNQANEVLEKCKVN